MCRSIPTAVLPARLPSTILHSPFDMTTMLVLNNVSKLGFGSVNIVNLYSRIMEKLNLRFNGDDELIDSEADAVLEQYAAMSDAIIIAWGTIGKNTLRVRERQKYLLELIKQHAGKMYQIGRNACHPLTPAVRREWMLEPYEMEEIET